MGRKMGRSQVTDLPLEAIDAMATSGLGFSIQTIPKLPRGRHRRDTRQTYPVCTLTSLRRTDVDFKPACRAWDCAIMHQLDLPSPQDARSAPHLLLPTTVTE